MDKREGYISWDEYFMGIALLSAKRSKDPNSQVGACIVNDDNKIVGIGYNGFPLPADAKQHEAKLITSLPNYSTLSYPNIFNNLFFLRRYDYARKKHEACFNIYH